ncbi:hypothetical protein [Leucobacter chinensis]|uniref:hypothetical protein n=1 Tax=Leucobacter chinensis TaxID=2851010 RepID=UPI001C21F0E6|nr:hypothetical protein [Leucobacter chinensis]
MNLIAPNTLVVVGDGLPELAVALDFASVGVPVTVIADRAATGSEFTGPQSDPSGKLAAWIDEVAAPLPGSDSPSCLASRRDPLPLWVRNDARWVMVPSDSVFGIPSSPLSVEVSDALGGAAAFRAYLDRLKPVLTIGKTQYIGDLVRNRVGQKVLDTFVEPQVQYLFGEPSTAVEVIDLAPGLNEAETRAGSLSGAALAYLDRYPALAAGTEPDVGWAAFTELLKKRLDHYGVQWLSPEAKVTTTRAEAADGTVTWLVHDGAAEHVASMLASAAPLAADGAVRYEIAFSHAAPEWWPAPTGETAAALQLATVTALPTDGAGVNGQTWSARTVVQADGAAGSVLRGPVVTAASQAPGTTELGHLCATFGLDRPSEEAVSVCERAAYAPVNPVAQASKSANAAKGSTEAATDESDTATVATEMRVECGVASSERGLAEALERARTQAKELRREALGLV